MREKAKAAVLAAFAADSLALGVHWIYNTRVIDKKLGRVEILLKPEIASFHKGKEKGDFTHYGDQTLVLMESVTAKSGFDLDDFAHRWQALFEDYAGYIDGASKETLKHFAAGKSPEESGSDSSDLGGAARIAPLLHHYLDNPDQLVAASKAQTAMTHNHPLVVASAAFFARVGWQVLNGATPVVAIEKEAATYADNDPIRRMVEEGLNSRDKDTRTAISEFGQMCEIDAAQPATIHLIAKYEDNLKEALVENVMAGGDSSARGLLTGMVLGARHGIDAIPADWLSGLTRHRRIMELLL